jgi:hypothetical protein
MTASASNVEVKEKALRKMIKIKQNHFSQRNGGPPNSKEDYHINEARVMKPWQVTEL